ncbi:type IV secretory system conjugative DNA transfer family protein [Psychroserpens algicola]|uniref:Type IV secretory system conjugative DNA transfer family protein n=1 Tax=Psychroserpens algicola TaxID=1719034 RepID=A0ABT0H4G2_9FLAO|nr:type IV secretory system conjugative DNA transfer family protein [Psychroserpens algicola]MCK8479052.1 type IV secretory system conjugative DNA transfer family protein [Psychroserpens algicola]
MIKSIIDIAVESLGGIGTFISEIFDDLTQKDHSVKAEFGNPNKLISKSNKGWCVDGKRFLDLKMSRQNMCVVAGSGKGKTQVHIYPTLMNSNSSMVVNDNSSELSKTVPYLKSKGAIPLIMNLTQKSGVYLNPLDGCHNNKAAIRKVSKTLMGSVSKETDFFSTSGEDCLSLFIQYVLESEPRIHANLGNVYRLLLEYQGSPDVIERLFADKASEDVWSKFLALAGNSERTLKSITATALSALSWLGDNPVLADITSVTNISFEAFREKQHVLFIQSPVSDTKLYAPMVSLVFQSFYRFAFSKLPSEKDLDIMMVLDEFSTLIGGLPDYSNTISNSRKFKIPQLIVLQDESLLSPYKELKDNILGNCFVKCYYGGQDKKAFELEKLLGSYTYEDKTSKQKKTRPLMYANEIRELDTEILVIPNGQKPLKVKITPTYKQSKLRKRLAMEFQEGTDENTEYSIQYIDLSPYRNENEEQLNNQQS